MFKNNPKLLAALVATGIAGFGIVQYLAMSGLIPVPALARIHWILLPGYWVGGAFGVMLQWFLIAALSVSIMSAIAKRKQASDGDAAAAEPAEHASQPAPSAIQRSPTAFGRRGRA